ncbi:MAG: hypothetical protein E4H13_15395 [Calditrichales bacterium]|nr:MAG: hypothetical protein E4H13_15395 [Calditrichales bacterium]
MGYLNFFSLSSRQWGIHCFISSLPFSQPPAREGAKSSKAIALSLDSIHSHLSSQTLEPPWPMN